MAERVRDTGVDLYAGAGGVTAGLKAAGVQVLAAVEKNPTACETYRANHPEVHLFVEDISNVSPAELLKSTGLVPGELGILTACAPCQGFSSLGSKRSDDLRNDLVLNVLSFVELLRPATVALENVPGLVRDLRFEVVCDRLRQLGYGVRWRIVNASELGVPQRRRRVVVLAMDALADDEVPLVEAVCKPKWVREAWEEAKLKPLDTGDALHVSRAYPPTVFSRIRAIPKNGGSRGDLPPHLRLRCHENVGRNAGSVYGRMRWDDVAPTMTTRCTSPSCGRFLHPEEDRSITLREASVLQTFDPEYEFRGGRMSIEAQIGNAVPVKLAQEITDLHIKHGPC